MNEIWDRLREKPELNEEIRVKIVAAFGRKGSSALGAIDAGRVKKYLDFFVVEGKTASYIVEEDFCTCGDFLYRGRNCWHLLAVRIARETSTYQSVNSWYHETMKEKPAK